jgi:hypothetical protein
MRFSYIFSSRDCFTLTLSWNCHVFLILKLLQFLIVGLPQILVNELQKIFLIGDCNTHSYFGLVTLSYFLLWDYQQSYLMILIEGLSHIFLSCDCYTFLLCECHIYLWWDCHTLFWWDYHTFALWIAILPYFGLPDNRYHTFLS